MHCGVSKLCSYKFLDLWPTDYNRLLQYWCQQFAVNSTLCQTKHVTGLTSVVFYSKNPRLCAFAWKSVTDNVLWYFLLFNFLSLYVMVADKVLVEPLSFSLSIQDHPNNTKTLLQPLWSGIFTPQQVHRKTNWLEITYLFPGFKLLWPLNITKVTETNTEV